MTKSQITFNNTTVIGTNNSLMVGELRILTEPPGAIDIRPVAPDGNSNIIIQKGDDTTLKQLIGSSPVRRYSMRLYDQCGHLCNKWDENRYDNSSGNVRITSETKALFSNIELPRDLNGHTYMIISTYSGFERCNMKSSKKYLAEQDFASIIEKSTMLNVVLFISQHIKDELGEIGIDLTKIFKSVYSSSVQTLLPYFVEFIAGKSVAGSRPSFQGMLHFGTKIEIAVARFRSVKDASGIECQIRRGGRIQINSENKNCAVKFFIILKKPESAEIKITEEITKTEFPVVKYTEQTLPGLESENFTTLFNGFVFLEQLNACRDVTTMTKFVKSCPDQVVSYYFDSPLTVFETLESDSDLTQMIAEYASTLRQQIYQVLSTHANKVFASVSKKARKNVMFNDHEMHPNYSEANRLYSTAVNNYEEGPTRLSSIPFRGNELQPAVSCGVAQVPYLSDKE